MDNNDKDRKIPEDISKRDYYINMVCEESGLDRDWVTQEMDFAKANGIKYKVYALKGYWLIPHDRLLDAHFNGQHRRSIARKIAALRGRDRHEVEKEMLRAKYTLGLRVGYFKKYNWDLMSEEQKEQMLLRPHSAAMSRKYRKPDADSKILDQKRRFYDAFPEMIGRKWFQYDCDMTVEEFQEEISQFDSEEAIIKPDVSSGGKGIWKEKLSDDPKQIWERICTFAADKEEKGGIIEECLVQHEDMKRLCPESINTIRAVTLYWEGKYKLFYTVCRMGAGEGKPVDNVSRGGLAISVDTETGKFNTVAADKFGEPVTKHPLTGVELVGYQVPYWNEVLSLVKAAAIKIYNIAGLGYTGWDVAITPDGPVMIEGNNWPSPSLIQLCNWIDSQKGMKYLFDPYL